VKEVDAVVGGGDPRGGGNISAVYWWGFTKNRRCDYRGNWHRFPNALERKLFEKLQQIPARGCPFSPSRKLVNRIGFSQIVAGGLAE